MLSLLEAHIGERLRGVIRTKEPEAEPLVDGALSQRDLRMELLSGQRMSRQALDALIIRCRAALIRAGLNGATLIQQEDDWVRLNLSPACSIDLYR